MSRRRSEPQRARTARVRTKKDVNAVLIHSEVLECLELFALLLVRCNVPRELAIRHFSVCMEQLPPDLGATTTGDAESPQSDYVPAEVLTRWHVAPKWVGPDGQPRALPTSGTQLSVAALVREVDPTADAQQILKYLVSIRAVTRVGKRYVPLERKARHRLSGRRLRAFNFRASLALLRVVESNVREGRARQYQFTTDGNVPEHRLADFREAMTDLADATLMSADNEMVRESTSSQRGARAVPMTLGVFLGERDRCRHSSPSGSPIACPRQRVVSNPRWRVLEPRGRR